MNTRSLNFLNCVCASKLGTSYTQYVILFFISQHYNFGTIHDKIIYIFWEKNSINKFLREKKAYNRRCCLVSKIRSATFFVISYQLSKYVCIYIYSLKHILLHSGSDDVHIYIILLYFVYNFMMTTPKNYNVKRKMMMMMMQMMRGWNCCES